MSVWQKRALIQVASEGFRVVYLVAPSESQPKGVCYLLLLLSQSEERRRASEKQCILFPTIIYWPELHHIAVSNSKLGQEMLSKSMFRRRRKWILENNCYREERQKQGTSWEVDFVQEREDGSLLHSGGSGYNAR